MAEKVGIDRQIEAVAVITKMTDLQNFVRGHIAGNKSQAEYLMRNWKAAQATLEWVRDNRAVIIAAKEMAGTND